MLSLGRTVYYSNGQLNFKICKEAYVLHEGPLWLFFSPILFGVNRVYTFEPQEWPVDSCLGFLVGAFPKPHFWDYQ